MEVEEIVRVKEEFECMLMKEIDTKVEEFRDTYPGLQISNIEVKIKYTNYFGDRQRHFMVDDVKAEILYDGIKVEPTKIRGHWGVSCEDK